MNPLRSRADEIVRAVVTGSRQEYKLRHFLGGYLFFTAVELTFVPLLLTRTGQWLDASLNLQSLIPHSLGINFGVLSLAFSIPWLTWACLLDSMIGSGTPLPLVPPKRLVITGPYRFTRNPQTFGAIFWWSGWALIASSPIALLVGVPIILAGVFSYIRLIEEKELAIRFGREYIDYKARTPFIFPRYTPAF